MKYTISPSNYFNFKNWVLIGKSRNPKHFSNLVLKMFIQNNFNVYTVNPLDKSSSKSVSDIDRPIDVALIMLEQKAISIDLIEECINKGIKNIWIYQAIKDKTLHRTITELCRCSGINYVINACPLMFLPDTGFIHNVHGLMLKLFGKYPD